MRYVRYALLALLAICLITVAMANRSTVTLHLLPGTIAEFISLPNALELPLFVVVFGGIIAGLLIGFIWEWVREYKIRAKATKSERKVKKLEREVGELKGDKRDETDEIIAMMTRNS